MGVPDVRRPAAPAAPAPAAQEAGRVLGARALSEPSLAQQQAEARARQALMGGPAAPRGGGADGGGVPACASAARPPAADGTRYVQDYWSHDPEKMVAMPERVGSLDDMD